jgi:hypothetical protein
MLLLNNLGYFRSNARWSALCLRYRAFNVSNRIQVRPLFATNSDPSDGAKTGVAEPPIAKQSRSWRAASGKREVMRGS